MKNLGYYNGEIGLIEDMRIPVSDRVCWFGDGVYDAAMCANYTIFALDEHIDRFYKSAEAIRIKVPISKKELNNLLCSLVKKLDSPQQLVYWQVTRASSAERTHAFDADQKANLWITLRKDSIDDIYKKLKLITVEDTRYFHCNIKTLNLLPNVLAMQKAKEAGCDEAVFCRGRQVTECSHSNIHILKNKQFKTAPTDNLILPGVARAHLIKNCRALGIPVIEQPFTIDEMMNADEIIISNCGLFCAGVSHINNCQAGSKDKETLLALQDMSIKEFYAATGINKAAAQLNKE
ncbi:MAG: aminotransferase class IV [Elusimicrobiota bacterium]|jgi:D-alanine transaminase|nr:aminotransferase class IV [Elusimicrobiota bacterium]